MCKELKKAIMDWLLENENQWQRVNVCREAFRPYIYDADGNHLIGGEIVSKFITDADKLLYGKDGISMNENAVRDPNGYPVCCDCQFCGDKFSFPIPNDKILTDPENPLLKHFYCCHEDCHLYGQDVTNLGLKKCDCFEAL